MATLTIKNVPNRLMDRLKNLTAAGRRSINAEIVFFLDQMTRRTVFESDAVLARARRVRRNPRGLQLDDELLLSLKRGLKGMPMDNLRDEPKGRARS
jgi:plasmid stability protein